MQFVFQPLAWGFLLVLLPLLIHLINLVRHRRTQWAAMEFLLESYRKLRRWVWLKQALLIASRMLIVAIAVAMLAQWVSGSRWLAMISQSTTHHYVILDDSASMSDTSSKGTAYQSALGAVQSIAANANTQEGSHLLTVIRASRAALASAKSKAEKTTADTKKTATNPTNSSAPAKSSEQQGPQADSVAELLSRTIPTDPSSLLSKINSTTPTSLDSGLGDSIELISPLLQQAPSEKSLVYLISDFRSKDWSNPAMLKQQLQSLPTTNTEIQLIDCVAERHENLTLISVLPQQEVLAAGVPAMINISVRNNGIAPVRNVSVRVNSVDYGNRQMEPAPTAPFSGLITELPPVLIDRIEPGELVTRHVQVLFPKPGSHVVEAQLPSDSLNADNSARCVLDLQNGLRVLLIDGDSTGKHSFFFESALNPGGNAKTGLIMSREGPEFLRDADFTAIQNYACILMQGVPSLDPRALQNLHKYVSQGGGLGVFFGEQMSTADYLRYNSVWTKPIPSADNAIPLMPFKIKGAADLAQLAGDVKPDLIADNHPIFESFFGLSNSPFQFVRIQRYLELERELGDSKSEDGQGNAGGWKPVATLRNGKPILIDHSIGNGRVLYGLTALDRQWTNWPQDPTFVVAALKMVGYLSSFRTPDAARLAGTPMRWDFPSQEMLPEIQVFCPPTLSNGAKSLLNINALPAGESTFQASLNPQTDQETDDSLRAVLAAGNFEWWGTSIQGERVVKNFARNTPPIEGETEKVQLIELNRALSGVKFTYKSSESLGSNTALAGFANRNMLLMALLLLLLLFEQWLAWSASYHLPQRKT
jgi:Aerotolerance regulator N-terminal